MSDIKVTKSQLLRLMKEHNTPKGKKIKEGFAVPSNHPDNGFAPRPQAGLQKKQPYGDSNLGSIAQLIGKDIAWVKQNFEALKNLISKIS